MGFWKVFSAGDESGSASAFVDDGGFDGLLEVIFAGGPAGINETGTAHIAVSDLVAGQVDGVVGGEFFHRPVCASCRNSGRCSRRCRWVVFA